MKVQVELEVNAPAAEVWDILGPRFGEIGTWCATVNASDYVRNRIVHEGATCSGRACDTVFGDFVESFTHYDHQRMAMAYDATSEKLPFFIRKFFNNYEVRPVGEDRSIVTMKAGADMMQPFKLLMSPVMKMQVGKALMNQVEELKHYAETGDLHPRKIEANEKLARKRK